jgi:hypothetical protein
MEARWGTADHEPERYFPPRLAPHEQSVAVIPHRFNAFRVVRGGEAAHLDCETGRIPEEEADSADERRRGDVCDSVSPAVRRRTSPHRTRSKNHPPASRTSSANRQALSSTARPVTVFGLICTPRPLPSTKAPCCPFSPPSSPRPSADEEPVVFRIDNVLWDVRHPRLPRVSAAAGPRTHVPLTRVSSSSPQNVAAQSSAVSIAPHVCHRYHTLLPAPPSLAGAASPSRSRVARCTHLLPARGGRICMSTHRCRLRSQGAFFRHRERCRWSRAAPASVLSGEGS